jgi:pyridoxal phosphate enzyme (YggS family)
MTDLATRLSAVWDRIVAAGGSPGTVKLVAVTKGHDVSVAREAVAAGLVDLGENYAQELLDKAGAVEGAGVRWHFIGRIQRNKVKAIAPLVHLWHGVDRLSAGEEIARRAPGAAVLIQVNASGEESKAGCRPEEFSQLLSDLRDAGLDVRGIMTMAPLGDREAARRAFEKAKELAGFHGLPELSMGMSDDFDLAVAAGATMVRVGSALFGPRPRPAGVGH